jgi:alpha-1,3-rhamnosyl/mannosyltransferase
MRVIVNELPALTQKTGVGHYTSEVLRCMRARAGNDGIDSFPTGGMRALCRLGYRTRSRLVPACDKPGTPPGALRSAVGRCRAQLVEKLRTAKQTVLARHFRSIVKHNRYDLYHEPNYISLPSDCPTVVTVHDLSIIQHPEWHPADRVSHFEQHFPRVLERSVHFLTDSEFSRQEMIRALGIGPAKVTRIAMGIRPGLRPLPPAELSQSLRRLQLPSRYLLYVGTIEPRKNVLLLLRAYCALPAPLRSRWPLLLVGGWGWNSTPVAEYWHNEARHKGVLHLGYVADEHLAAVYQGARALVYPSLYEGFGLPPLEMLACGGAVLASTAGALEETLGTQAHLVPAEDFDGWRAALARVLTDADWWRELRRGATAMARPYTWERCADETLQVYRRLCGRETSRPVTVESAA